MIIGTITMAIATVALYVFATPLIRVFTPDQEVIALAARCLQIVALIQIPQMAAWVFGGLLRGAGDTKIIFYITASTNWGIRTLFSVLVIRAFHMDLIATIWVMCAEILVRLFLLYLRYRSGKWEHIMKH